MAHVQMRPPSQASHFNRVPYPRTQNESAVLSIIVLQVNEQSYRRRAPHSLGILRRKSTRILQIDLFSPSPIQIERGLHLRHPLKAVAHRHPPPCLQSQRHEDASRYPVPRVRSRCCLPRSLYHCPAWPYPKCLTSRSSMPRRLLPELPQLKRCLGYGLFRPIAHTAIV